MKTNHPTASSAAPADHPTPEITGRSALDWAQQSGVADRVVGEVERLVHRRRRRFRVLTAGAVAAIALGFVVRSTFLPSTPFAEGLGRPSPAVVMLPARQILPDGSVVELKDGAAIEVDFSDALRRVVLRRGEAHFHVTKNPQRPFVVAAGKIEVRAVGTAFAVQLADAAIEVIVTEGRVAVGQTAAPATTCHAEAQPAPALLAVVDVGNRIVVDTLSLQSPAPAPLPTPQVVAVSAHELGERLAWRVPRLEFSGTLLSEAVAMFNEHGHVHLVLDDPALGRLQLSGLLRADNADALLRLLQSEFAIQAEHRGDAIILHR
jgi:transmembrane sensor